MKQAGKHKLILVYQLVVKSTGGLQVRAVCGRSLSQAVPQRQKYPRIPPDEASVGFLSKITALM